MYVGKSVGETDGALLGDALGLGVGLLALYVGTKVGAAVGADDGIWLGSGVGAALTTLRITTPEKPLTLLLTVKVVLDVTAVTTVAASIEPETTLALVTTASTRTLLVSDTVRVLPTPVAERTMRVPTVADVGAIVGATVGALLGEALGIGVGTLKMVVNVIV